MKVEIGNHTNAELLQELKEQRVQFNPFALQLFEDQMIQTKQRGQTLSVLVITPSDLGQLLAQRWLSFLIMQL